MRALVTGGTGFIGPRLLAGLENPVILSRRPDAAREKLKIPGADYYAWDPEKERPPAKAFEGVDVVYHLAGQAYPARSWQQPGLTLAVNSVGTANLLHAVVQYGRPRVLIVDDERVIREILADFLSLEGFLVLRIFQRGGGIAAVADHQCMARHLQ